MIETLNIEIKKTAAKKYKVIDNSIYTRLPGDYVLSIGELIQVKIFPMLGGFFETGGDFKDGVYEIKAFDRLYYHLHIENLEKIVMRIVSQKSKNDLYFEFYKDVEIIKSLIKNGKINEGRYLYKSLQSRLPECKLQMQDFVPIC